MSNQHICEDESRPREDCISTRRDGRIIVENQSGKAITAVVVTMQKIEPLRARNDSTINIEAVHSSRYPQTGIPSGKSAEIQHTAGQLPVNRGAHRGAYGNVGRLLIVESNGKLR